MSLTKDDSITSFKSLFNQIKNNGGSLFGAETNLSREAFLNAGHKMQEYSRGAVTCNHMLNNIIIDNGFNWDQFVKAAQNYKGTQDSANIVCKSCGSEFERAYVKDKLKRFGDKKNRFYTTRHCPHCDGKVSVKDDMQSEKKQLERLQRLLAQARLLGDREEVKELEQDIKTLQEEMMEKTKTKDSYKEIDKLDGYTIQDHEYEIVVADKNNNNVVRFPYKGEAQFDAAILKAEGWIKSHPTKDSLATAIKNRDAAKKMSYDTAPYQKTIDALSVKDDREPDQKDIEAAQRGNNMLGMSLADLGDLVRLMEGKQTFAANVTVVAAKQMIASKKRMGAKDSLATAIKNRDAAKKMGYDTAPYQKTIDAIGLSFMMQKREEYFDKIANILSREGISRNTIEGYADNMFDNHKTPEDAAKAILYKVKSKASNDTADEAVSININLAEPTTEGMVVPIITEVTKEAVGSDVTYKDYIIKQDAATGEFDIYSVGGAIVSHAKTFELAKIFIDDIG